MRKRKIRFIFLTDYSPVKGEALTTNVPWCVQGTKIKFCGFWRVKCIKGVMGIDGDGGIKNEKKKRRKEEICVVDQRSGQRYAYVRNISRNHIQMVGSHGKSGKVWIKQVT